MAENIKVTDSISLWIADGRITLCDENGSAMVEVETSDVNTLRAKLATAHLIATEQQAADPCPYTHAHTRNWCGHIGCRKI